MEEVKYPIVPFYLTHDRLTLCVLTDQTCSQDLYALLKVMFHLPESSRLGLLRSSGALQLTQAHQLEQEEHVILFVTEIPPSPEIQINQTFLDLLQLKSMFSGISLNLFLDFALQVVQASWELEKGPKFIVAFLEKSGAEIPPSALEIVTFLFQSAKEAYLSSSEFAAVWYIFWNCGPFDSHWICFLEMLSMVDGDFQSCLKIISFISFILFKSPPEAFSGFFGRDLLHFCEFVDSSVPLLGLFILSNSSRNFSLTPEIPSPIEKSRQLEYHYGSQKLPSDSQAILDRLRCLSRFFCKIDFDLVMNRLGLAPIPKSSSPTRSVNMRHFRSHVYRRSLFEQVLIKKDEAIFAPTNSEQTLHRLLDILGSFDAGESVHEFLVSFSDSLDRLFSENHDLKLKSLLSIYGICTSFHFKIDEHLLMVFRIFDEDDDGILSWSEVFYLSQSLLGIFTAVSSFSLNSLDLKVRAKQWVKLLAGKGNLSAKPNVKVHELWKAFEDCSQLNKSPTSSEITPSYIYSILSDLYSLDFCLYLPPLKPNPVDFFQNTTCDSISQSLELLQILSVFSGNTRVIEGKILLLVSKEEFLVLSQQISPESNLLHLFELLEYVEQWCDFDMLSLALWFLSWNGKCNGSWLVKPFTLLDPNHKSVLERFELSRYFYAMCAAAISLRTNYIDSLSKTSLQQLCKSISEQVCEFFIQEKQWEVATLDDLLEFHKTHSWLPFLDFSTNQQLSAPELFYRVPGFLTYELEVQGNYIQIYGDDLNSSLQFGSQFIFAKYSFKKLKQFFLFIVFESAIRSSCAALPKEEETPLISQKVFERGLLILLFAPRLDSNQLVSCIKSSLQPFRKLFKTLLKGFRSAFGWKSDFLSLGWLLASLTPFCKGSIGNKLSSYFSMYCDIDGNISSSDITQALFSLLLTVSFLGSTRTSSYVRETYFQALQRHCLAMTTQIAGDKGSLSLSSCVSSVQCMLSCHSFFWIRALDCSFDISLGFQDSSLTGIRVINPEIGFSLSSVVFQALQSKSLTCVNNKQLIDIARMSVSHNSTLKLWDRFSSVVELIGKTEHDFSAMFGIVMFDGELSLLARIEIVLRLLTRHICTYQNLNHLFFILACFLFMFQANVFLPQSQVASVRSILQTISRNLVDSIPVSLVKGAQVVSSKNWSVPVLSLIEFLDKLMSDSGPSNALLRQFFLSFENSAHVNQNRLALIMRLSMYAKEGSIKGILYPLPLHFPCFNPPLPIVNAKTLEALALAFVRKVSLMHGHVSPIIVFLGLDSGVHPMILDSFSSSLSREGVQHVSLEKAPGASVEQLLASARCHALVDVIPESRIEGASHLFSLDFHTSEGKFSTFDILQLCESTSHCLDLIKRGYSILDAHQI